MRSHTRTAVVTAASAVVLVGAGGVAVATGAVDPGGDDLDRAGTVTVDEGTLPDDDDDAAERAALAELASVDEAAAGQAAVDSLGGGDVLRSELEDEDGYVVWEVTVRAADGAHHEVTIDAGDATVLGTERDDDEDEDRLIPGSMTVDEGTLPDDDDAAERAALAELASVDEAAAGQAAVDSLGGGDVLRSELEDEDGYVVWEVTVRASDGAHHEVTIDAGDATVLGTELDED